MRLRTFTADTMQEALSQVKAALGDDALILSTEEKRDGVYITAAVDADSLYMPKKPPTTNHQPRTTRIPPQGDAIRFDVQHDLRFHNLPEIFIAKFAATLNDATIAQILGKGRINIADESRYFLQLALEHVCNAIVPFTTLPASPHRLMLVGTSGAGKTLTIAKLATQHHLAGHHTLVITTDVKRAGGIEQLKSFTDILGVPLSVCPDKKALTAVLKSARPNHYVLIDTAGCNPYSAKEMSELAQLSKAAHVELALVMPAGMDAQEAIDITEAFSELPLSHLIATRADCTRRFGGLLAASIAHQLPFSLVGDSASVTNNMTELNAKTMVGYMLNNSR